MSEGLIFDIKRYSINDGPGIRTTVFMKGCPLHCRWCHNPEGRSSSPEVMVRPGRCLEGCSECLAACPEQAIRKEGAIPAVDRTLCQVCGECAAVCPTRAVEVVGRRLTAPELIKEIEKDRVFYEESGGGATFSGGEPLAQPEFLEDILELCRQRGIHSAVDTCGFAPAEVLEKIAAKAGLFLFDLKAMDEKKHLAFTGQSNGPILANLERLAGAGSKIIIRIPVVPGVNDDLDNIRMTASFLRSLGGIAEVSLLPYHGLGRDKARGIDKDDSCQDFAPLASGHLQKVKAELETSGFQVKQGE